MESKVAEVETGGTAEVTEMGRCREKKEDILTSGFCRWSVGGTWGTFNGGLAVFLRAARPVSFLVGDLVVVVPAVV